MSLLSEIEADLATDAPLAPTLRKCVLLGGQAGSVQLREWSMKELRGYKEDGESTPDYRTIGASIHASAVTGNTIVTGQHVGEIHIEGWDEPIREEMTFYSGIGEVEALIQQAENDNGFVKLALPLGIAALIDQQSGNPFQQTTALYRNVSVAALRGIVDQVRTTLTELVAEMRAGLPSDAETPSAALATQALNVAVHGNKARVTVTNAQSADNSTSTTAAPKRKSFWTPWRRVGAALVGLAGIGTFVLEWLARK